MCSERRAEAQRASLVTSTETVLVGAHTQLWNDALDQHMRVASSKWRDVLIGVGYSVMCCWKSQTAASVRGLEVSTCLRGSVTVS